MNKKITLIGFVFGLILLSAVFYNRYCLAGPEMANPDFAASSSPSHLPASAPAAALFPHHESFVSTSTEKYSERIPILMYHYIEAPKPTTTLPNLYIAPEIFANQLQEIKRLDYQTIFMSEAALSLRAGKDLPKDAIALTFDDGYEDFYTNAFPLLKKFEIKATIYVIINRLGQPGYLTREQVKEMAGSGFVEIGSHTFNHPDLRKLSERDAVFEIKDSRRVLREISGQAVVTFAYPYGDYDSSDLAIASSTGYLAAVSVDPGVRQSPDNIFLLHRLRADRSLGEKFARGIERWLDAVRPLAKIKSLKNKLNHA